MMYIAHSWKSNATVNMYIDTKILDKLKRVQEVLSYSDVQFSMAFFELKIMRCAVLPWLRIDASANLLLIWNSL